MYIRFLQFRSSLLSESLLLSFPLPTKIFQFDRSCFLADTFSPRMWVLPFGFLRIVAYLQLPEAFRRSSRPSSPSSAKASTVRPLFLNLFLILIRLNFYLLFKDLFSRNFSLSKLYTTNKHIFYLVVYLMYIRFSLERR